LHEFGHFVIVCGIERVSSLALSICDCFILLATITVVVVVTIAAAAIVNASTRASTASEIIGTANIIDRFYLLVET
jgi:hypothetical protein